MVKSWQGREAARFLWDRTARKQLSGDSKQLERIGKKGKCPGYKKENTKMFRDKKLVHRQLFERKVHFATCQSCSVKSAFSCLP
jgi:hypothetical protein